MQVFYSLSHKETSNSINSGLTASLLIIIMQHLQQKLVIPYWYTFCVTEMPTDIGYWHKV